MNLILRSITVLMLTWLLVIFISINVHAQLATQVGIGALFINGDVDPVVDPLNSFHLGLSKKFRNNFDVELRLGFSKTVGLSGSYMEVAKNGGALVEDVYSILNENVWYPNYLSTYAYADMGVNYILNTGIERLRFIGGAGLGISLSNLRLNLIGLEDTNYKTKLPITTSLSEAKDAINRLYDTTYETEFAEGGGLTPHLSFQLGVQFKITKGIFFSVDVRYHLTTSDYLDPIKYISSTQESGNNDSVSMFTIGFIGYMLADTKEDSGPVK